MAQDFLQPSCRKCEALLEESSACSLLASAPEVVDIVKLSNCSFMGLQLGLRLGCGVVGLGPMIVVYLWAWKA